MKRVYRDKEASVHWSAARNTERSSRGSAAYQQVVNQSLCSSTGLHRISERCSGDVSPMPWRVRGTLMSWANCSVGVALPGPTPLPRRAPRPDPPVVCPGFGIDKLVIDMLRSDS